MLSTPHCHVLRRLFSSGVLQRPRGLASTTRPSSARAAEGRSDAAPSAPTSQRAGHNELEPARRSEPKPATTGHAQPTSAAAPAAPSWEGVTVMARPRPGRTDAEQSGDGWTCLHWAAYRGNRGALAEMLADGSKQHSAAIAGALVVAVCMNRCGLNLAACTGTGLAPSTSVPRTGLTRAICTGTELASATSAPGLGSPVPHLRRDWAA